MERELEKRDILLRNFKIHMAPKVKKYFVKEFVRVSEVLLDNILSLSSSKKLEVKRSSTWVNCAQSIRVLKFPTRKTSSLLR